MEHEHFQWQKKGQSWHRPCIYHVTMAAYKRERIFAQLTGTPNQPKVEKTDIGWALIHNLTKTCELCPELKIIADQVMPDHLHLVIQVTKTMDRSIREVLRGYMQGCKAEARQLGRKEPLFEDKPFVRPLSHRGQLKAMIDYTKANPRRALLKRDNPELFQIKRQTTIEVDGGQLTFTSMGNHFLVQIPTCRLVTCSRSITEEQIAALKKQVLEEADNGVIIYTAAISEGEKQIARAVREAGYPLVVLLKEGFPASNSEQEKYYKPKGVYFEACAAGKLLLLEATEEMYEQPRVQAATEQALRAKAEARHIGYAILPTTSTRYRFMALNEMGRMMVERDRDDGTAIESPNN